MGRLINIGAGDVADRLTVLSLKLQHADAAGKPADHFRNEQVALATKLKAGNGIAAYLDELLELATVNGLLWRAEDELRANRTIAAECKGGEPFSWQAVGAIAFRIQALNDRRAALVEAINQKTGEARGLEKL